MRPGFIKSPLALLLASGVMLTSCGEDPVAAPVPPKPQTDREKAINNTQAASVVGHDGDALKQSVQQMVDGAEKQQAKTAETTAAAAGLPSAEEPAADAPAAEEPAK